MSKIVREFKLQSVRAYDSGTNRIVVSTQPKKQPDGSKWKCPKCGKYNSALSKRCAHCGASIDDPVD